MNLFGLDPLSFVVGAGCDAVGLPPEVKGAVKIGAACFTGDVVMGADGAMNLLGGLGKGAKGPQTEHVAPRAGAAAAQGFAPPPSGVPGMQGLLGGGGAPPANAFEATMSKLADPLGLFPGVRLFDPLNLFGLLGLGGKPPEANAPPPAVANDADRVEGTGSGVKRKAGRCPPGKVTGGECSPPPSKTRERPGDRFEPGSHLDPNVTEYRHCLRTLVQNWDTFDTAAGRHDERLTRENLAAIDKNPAASAELKGAARFLLQHDEYFRRLDMAARVGGSDGVIGRGDVESDLRRVDADIARYGLPIAHKSAAMEGSGALEGRAQEILQDSSLSMEDKIQLLLQHISDDLDTEILDTLAAQDTARAGGGSEADQLKAQKASEQLQLKLQKLMERRKQMFDLMTNLSEKFNEMSKAAIQNLGRA